MQPASPITRTPYFCSGCPHNTSTKVPEGSRAFAGIGCHFMALWMDRNTETFTHMGGEGVPWVGVAPFTNEKHVFANLGDGTYFHSGSLAIRQAVASGANITYKILYNDATAMTGGQHVDGDLSPQQITFQLHSEGIRDIYLVSENPDAYPAADIAPGTKTAHRDELDAVMKTLREVKGASAIVFVQTCAAEKRRRRKRGTMEDPARRVLINPAVCEGCGDCSVQSNCISVEPLETEMGRKRTINQSTCNKDYSCLKGFCPSFVTVDGGKLRKRAPADLGDIGDLPEPASRPSLERPYNIAVGGVGGTGVLTIGALLGMAAHIEGKASMILDMSGLAQKGGAVLSHVRLSEHTADVTCSRIVTGTADLVIAADEVVAAAKETITLCESSRTYGVINTHLIPIADFILNRDFNFQSRKVNHVLETALRKDSSFFDFTKPAEMLLGDSIATNMMMMGYAYQKGLLPLAAKSIEQAIEVNGVAIKMNTQAFQLGRLAAVDPARLVAMMKGQDETVAPKTLEAMSLDEIIAHRSALLTDYQNGKLAERYRSLVAKVRDAAIDGGYGEALAARGRDQLRQAARLQGRVRGGAALYRRPVRKAAARPVRRRLQVQLQPRAAAARRRRRCAGPAEEARVRRLDDAGVPDAGEAARPARHRLRHLRLQRRPQARARPDRGLREGRRHRARPAVAGHAGHRGRTAVAAGSHPRLRPGEGEGGAGRRKPAMRNSPPTSSTRRRRRGRSRRSRACLTARILRADRKHPRFDLSLMLLAAGLPAIHASARDRVPGQRHRPRRSSHLIGSEKALRGVDGPSRQAIDDPAKPVAGCRETLVRRRRDAQQQTGSRRSRRRIPERQRRRRQSERERFPCDREVRRAVRQSQQHGQSGDRDILAARGRRHFSSASPCAA